MEISIAFAHGFVLALGLILPLGVQNVFIFMQGACQRRLSDALPAVITAALADTLLILTAVGGVSLAVLNFRWLQVMLLISGILFLGYMGWIAWQSSAEAKMVDSEGWPIGRQVKFALSVSFLNPHAIIDTIGVIGTSSLSYMDRDKIAFAFACILVSWLWFLFLAIAGRMVKVLDQSGYLLRLANRLSAVIMWASGLYLLYRLSITI
ncbi:MAG: LysE family transporter [Negativicutes bacterium]|nr:LysE family transporter [Negativicutes bacterium]